MYTSGNGFEWVAILNFGIGVRLVATRILNINECLIDIDLFVSRLCAFSCNCCFVCRTQGQVIATAD